MQRLVRPFTAALLFLGLACGKRSVLVDSGHVRTGASVILVSLDGFRPDYFDQTLTPGLARLALEGIRAEALVPSFPTKTFPNHFTLVTGLVPDHHGIIANNMWDPERRESFGLGNREAVQTAAWYEGVPIWTTAEAHGLATAPMFWPGSEAALGGRDPTYWLPYDGDMPYADRVSWVVERVAGRHGPPARFATLYFDAVDAAGHRHGPDAPETLAAAARVDSMIVLLLDRLAQLDLENRVDVIVVSDHGMSQLSRDRVVFLDDYIDPDSVRVVDWSPVLAVWPEVEQIEPTYRRLAGAHPHLAVYRRSELPGAFDYGTHPRVAPIIGIVKPGWAITTRSYFNRNPERFDGGTHGYDHTADDMRGLFVAAGPSFRSIDGTVAPFPNTDVYELIMEILGLPTEPGDGRLERVRYMVR